MIALGAVLNVVFLTVQLVRGTDINAVAHRFGRAPGVILPKFGFCAAQIMAD